MSRSCKVEASIAMADGNIPKVHLDSLQGTRGSDAAANCPMWHQSVIIRRQCNSIVDVASFVACPHFFGFSPALFAFLSFLPPDSISR